MHVHLRPENASDRDAVERLHRRAFGGAREARLVHELRFTAAYLRELSLIVEADGEQAGHAMLTRIEIAPRGGDPVAALALAPVAIDPDRRGLGLGAALVRGALDRAREMGHRIVVALGPAEFYAPRGFAPLGRFGLAPPFEVFGAAWMARELVPGALAGVSGALSLPAPFDFVLGR
jgi:putative acetyltransferase